MSTYRASVRVDDGTLTVSRPLTAPDRISDLIDSLTYASRDLRADDVLSIDLEVETDEDSETPIGDSVAATSSTPLGQPDDEEDVADVPAPAPGAQQ